MSTDKIGGLYMAPVDHIPVDEPLPWNFRFSSLNESMVLSNRREVLLDTRKPLAPGWWEEYGEIERLEVHGDLPGGFDVIRNFTDLEELAIYDSPSLADLSFLSGLRWLANLQVIRCPALEDIGPMVSLLRRRKGDLSVTMGMCIKDCGIKDLSPFDGLGADDIAYLFELNLKGNQIVDVSPLAGLHSFDLDLSHNRIEDIHPIYDLLRRRGSYYLNDNRIRDISGLTAGLEPYDVIGIKLWLANNDIPKEQLRENEDCIRDIDPADISPSKMEWVTKTYSQFESALRPRRNAQDKEEDEDSFGSHTTIRYTERSYEDGQPEGRWPSYSIRGKPVSKETALHIIRKTDDYLHAFDSLSDTSRSGHGEMIQKIFARHGAKPDNIDDYHLAYPMHWFPERGGKCFGWCHPDGYIGLDYYSCEKNPFLEEMLDHWVYVIENITTELDVVVGIGEYDEEFDPTRPIADQLCGGYHIKGDTITLLDAAQTRKLYREYDEAYGDHELRGPLDRGEDRETHRIRSVTDDIWVEKSARWATTPGILYICVPGEHGKVDKNHCCYYGVPDYESGNSPLTLRDLELFAMWFRAEQDEGLFKDGADEYL